MMLVLVCAIIATGVGPMAIEAARGEFTFVNPKNLFVAHYVVVLGLSGLMLIVAGPSTLFWRDYTATPDVYQRALWVSLAGLIAFHAGYYLQRRVYVRPPWLFLAPWSPRRVCLVAALCYAAGALAFAAIIRENGGLGDFLRGRDAWRAIGFKGHGVAFLACTTLVALASHLLFITFVGPRTRRRTVALVLLAYALGALPAYVIGSRSLLAMPLVQLVILWHVRRRRIPTGTLLAIVACFLVALTSYGIVRSVPPGEPGDAAHLREVVGEHPGLLFAPVARVRGVEILADVMHRLGETGAYDTSPRSVVEVATIMIPSSLWRQKPLSTIERFSTDFYGDDFIYVRGPIATTFGGVSPTIATELYWHLGTGGVVIGLFLFGIAVRVVYHTIREFEYSNGVLLLYVAWYTAIGMTAETLQLYVNTAVITTVLIVLLLIAVTARRSPVFVDGLARPR